MPKDVLESLGVRLNDYLQIEVQDECIVLKKTFKHMTLEERAAIYEGKLGPYEEFQWEEPVGREKW